MPTTTTRTRKTTASRTRKSTPIPHDHVMTSNVCAGCNALPAGSMELMALMLVLVFSLTAVLFTSVYALNIQEAKIQSLESQTAHLYLE